MAAWPTPERAHRHPRQPPSPGLGLLPLARAAGCPHLPGAPASVSSASRPSASALLTAPRPGPPLPPESVSSVMKSGRQADGPGHSRAAASGAVREGFRALVSAESRGGAGRGRGGRDGRRAFAVLGWTAPRHLGMSTSPVTSPGGVCNYDPRRQSPGDCASGRMVAESAVRLGAEVTVRRQGPRPWNTGRMAR